MRTIMYLSALCFSLLTAFSLSAQPSSRPDTTRRPGPPTPAKGPKPYADVITSKAVSKKGFINVHKVDETYFLEIPDSILNRDILVVNRISKAGAGMRIGGFFGYGGDQIGQNVIRFEKGPGNKIFLRTISFAEYAKDSTSPMFTAVEKSNVQPISASFDIKASGKDSTGAVIDITSFIESDNPVLVFSASTKTFLRLSSVQSDKSYIIDVNAYPVNIEIKTVKTYGRTPAPASTTGGGGGGGGGAAASSGNLTMELNSSLVLLPKTPMQPRYFDPRVGYFAVGYTDFDANPHGIKAIRMVKRWRLEPKEGDMQKYLKGELVEPAKPIVFYIDPATPEKWVPYLMQGVNDWQVAFEKAGFKNAIIAKRAPTKEEDSTWSLNDARHSAIVYKPSDIANASGPSISDPRSGEIMESHINWYHNVMELLQNWYFIQAAAVDTGARKLVFDDELMGQLIRFVSSHEVGHTLGLRHNFGSSSTVPVENLRNKQWVEANGHTPSIMDYARFNYVAQPEDNISRKGLFPRIGDYDEWAIDWGYRLFPQYGNADTEQAHLNRWVIEKLKNKRHWFGTESNPDDPRSQSEQVGDDAMKASAYGIKNLQRILPHLIEWTKEPNEAYASVNKIYTQLTGQFTRYMGHVAKYVGGIMETPKTVEEAGPVYEIVSKAKQREAVEFLNKNLFATPAWLIDQNLYSRTGASGLTVIGSIQDNILGRLFSARTLNKLSEAATYPAGQGYLLTDLFADLKKGIWSELPTRKTIDIYRRGLQKSYINILESLLKPPAASATSSASNTTAAINRSDVKSVVQGHLASLRSEINGAAAGTADLLSKYHLQDLSKRIDNILNPK